MKAYSLLETLLVVAVMAVVAFIGIQLLQQQVVQTKVNTTAAQIQIIKEAAQAYRGSHNSWPTQEEMPSMASCPQWTSTTSSPCYQIQGNPQDDIFSFTMDMSSWISSPQKAANIASMIASRLPDAVLKGGGSYPTIVQLYVPQPIARVQSTQLSSFVSAPINRGTYLLSIQHFYSQRPISVGVCEDATYERKIVFISSTYTNFVPNSASWLAQAMGGCPAENNNINVPCHCETTACHVQDVLQNPKGNGGLANPVIIPSSEPGGPFNMYPCFCDVSSNLDTKQTQIVNSQALGYVMVICEKPS